MPPYTVWIKTSWLWLNWSRPIVPLNIALNVIIWKVMVHMNFFQLSKSIFHCVWPHCRFRSADTASASHRLTKCRVCLIWTQQWRSIKENPPSVHFLNHKKKQSDSSFSSGLLYGVALRQGHNLHSHPAIRADITAAVWSSAAEHADSGYMCNLPMVHTYVDVRGSGFDRWAGQPGSSRSWTWKSHPQGGVPGRSETALWERSSLSILGCSIKLINGLITASKHS